MGFKLLETAEVTVSGSAIEFTDIPQTGNSLYILFSGRSSDNDNVTPIKVNSTVSANSTYLIDSAGSLFGSQTTNLFFYIPDSTMTSGWYGHHEIYIMDYTSTTRKKAAQAAGGYAQDSSNSASSLNSAEFQTTDAITSVKIDKTLAVGSRASLYLLTDD